MRNHSLFLARARDLPSAELPDQLYGPSDLLSVGTSGSLPDREVEEEYRGPFTSICSQG
jgi:hypothetical protein